MKLPSIFTILLLSIYTQLDSQPHSKPSLQIKPLYPFVQTVNRNNGYKVRFYEIENFRSYNEDSLTIDRYVAAHIDSDYRSHFNYSVQFFVRKINVVNQVDKKGQIVSIDYQNPVLAYNWSSGVFKSVNYTKNDLFLIYNKNKAGVFESFDTTASSKPVEIIGVEVPVQKN